MSKKKKQAAKPQKPRKYSPLKSKQITGWLMVVGILIAIVAINRESVLILLIAVVEWLISLCFMLYYWRCPKCGKSLPKTGKFKECPKCGAPLD